MPSGISPIADKPSTVVISSVARNLLFRQTPASSGFLIAALLGMTTSRLANNLTQPPKNPDIEVNDPG
jgi:hypothetical protein